MSLRKVSCFERTERKTPSEPIRDERMCVAARHTWQNTVRNNEPIAPKKQLAIGQCHGNDLNTHENEQGRHPGPALGLQLYYNARRQREVITHPNVFYLQKLSARYILVYQVNNMESTSFENVRTDNFKVYQRS